MHIDQRRQAQYVHINIPKLPSLFSQLQRTLYFLSLSTHEQTQIMSPEQQFGYEHKRLTLTVITLVSCVSKECEHAMILTDDLMKTICGYHSPRL